MFILNSEITIGNFRFSGVHDVRIERSIHTYKDMAYIRVPSVATIGKKSKATVRTATTASLFTDGAPVTIKLGYNGDLRTEFEGFVKRRNLGQPLEVECEGYFQKLRLKSIKANLSKGIDVKKLLTQICEGTGITVECPVSFTMYGRNLTAAVGTDLLDEIKKVSDDTVTVCFIEPKKLWVGLPYTEYLAGTDVFKLPEVKYRLGYNCLSDSGLRERIPNEKVQVICNGMLVSGDTVRTASDDKVAARKVKMMVNGVRDEAYIKRLANEKADFTNYNGYEGTLTGFLQPFCQPGYNAIVKDSRYPERDGTYLVEGVKVRFGVNGARRMVELGPRLGGAK